MERLVNPFEWSLRQGIIFLSFFLCFVAIPFFLETNSLGNALLWLTGVVVLIYTVETHGLRLEMVRQNEMTIQPVVTAKIAHREVQRLAIGSETFVTLHNIGRGPALQVEVKDIPYLETPDAKYRMKCKMIDFIEPGEEKPLEFTFICETDKENITEPSGGFAMLLDPNTAAKSYNFEIEYMDIGLQRHVSVVRMGKGGNVLIGTGKIIRHRKLFG